MTIILKYGNNCKRLLINRAVSAVAAPKCKRLVILGEMKMDIGRATICFQQWFQFGIASGLIYDTQVPLRLAERFCTVAAAAKGINLRLRVPGLQMMPSKLYFSPSRSWIRWWPRCLLGLSPPALYSSYGAGMQGKAADSRIPAITAQASHWTAEPVFPQ